MKAFNLASFVVMLVLLAGCSSSVDAVRYYLIEPVSVAGATNRGDMSIEIVDLEVPQYLDRLQIPSRRPDSQLVFASAHQWGESLRKNLTRALARNLTNLLGTAAIGTPANRLSSLPAYRLTVYIERFERGADGYVHLLVRWQLIHRETSETITNSSNEYISERRIDSPDFAGTVFAMSELLGEFSQTIAQRIEESQ
ncbi:MAG: membrane integrity-associated transporter subunit PqiC [Gammaproteobacteria bacterium]|nr:membrane integrity-associated transporter subunit PqiC [Gammaproteobacteria bacterium]MBT7798539.1 membrane integrity-associated transporter subunit PqiC [Gammaproteobacteria bacterium]